MSKDETKTPLEIAREVWPGLEWNELGAGVGVIAREPYTDQMLAFHPDPDGDGWAMWVSSTHREEKVGTDLRTALTEARRLTLERLEAAAALCREPYPVQVERHRGTGEAVLMLTASDDGEAIPMPIRLIEGGAHGVFVALDSDNELSVIECTNGRSLNVREPADAIRETLRMLAEEPAQ